MRLGVVEIVIGVILVSGLTWLAMNLTGHGSCGPVTLSPEVKAYIDSRAVGGQIADIPNLVKLVTDLQSKLTLLDSLRDHYNHFADNRDQVLGAIEKVRDSGSEIIARARAEEEQNLKKDLARECMNMRRPQAGRKAGSAQGSSILNNLPNNDEEENASPKK